MSKVILLSPATPSLTLSGVINAYGSVGTFAVYFATETAEAAVFGAAPTVFTITNTGFITSHGTRSSDAGIVLAVPGTVINQGTLHAPSGIQMFGTGAPGYILNSNLIDATNGTGAAILYTGTVVNTGTILAADDGIAAPTALNRGTIIATTGISGSGENFGLIEVTQGTSAIYHSIIYGTAVALAGRSFTNTAAGIISGGTKTTGMAGYYQAALYNAGTISAPVGVQFATGANFTNSGTVLATTFGVVGGYNYIPAQFTDHITNLAGGLISATAYGVVGVTSPTDIQNAGTILGNIGVVDSGTFTNTGTILGVHAGDVQYIAFPIDSTGQHRIAGLTNAGYIAASAGAGVVGGILGNVTNQSSGTIAGQSGIYLEAGSYLNIQPGNYLSNAGLITGVTDAVYLRPYGGEAATGQTFSSYVYNYGVMAGGQVGIYANPSPVTIFGAVTSVYAGIYNYGGAIIGATGIQITSGFIDNTGLIEGTAGVGISLTGGGTIIAGATGTIIGAIDVGKATSRLIIQPGAHFESSAAAPKIPSTINLDGGTLELAALPGATGTLFAQEASNARAITIDTGASWQLAAHSSFAQTIAITNNGTLLTDGAVLHGKITGKGEIALAAGTLTLDSAIGAKQTLKFSGGAADLALAQPTHFDAKLSGFAPGDTIDLTSLNFSTVKSLQFAAGILTITEQNGLLDLTFSNPSTLSGDIFKAFADGAGTGITLASQPAATIPLGAAPASLAHAVPVTLQT